MKYSKDLVADIGFDLSTIPFHKSMKPTLTDPLELYLNNTWNASLTVLGSDGLPAGSSAGNVLRPFTNLTISIWLPPNMNGAVAEEWLWDLILNQPAPYDCTVELPYVVSKGGWLCKEFSEWTKDAFTKLSDAYFNGKKEQYLACGGSIPFVNTLQEQYPNAQFIVSGVLGPNSNAHGPNEFLHIDYTKWFTSSIAYLISRAIKN